MQHNNIANLPISISKIAHVTPAKMNLALETVFDTGINHNNNNIIITFYLPRVAHFSYGTALPAGPA